MVSGMTDPVPPTFVRRPDGRLEPFDAGRISRALYAAAEAVGMPDPFLARELADGVLHFLALECEGESPTPARIAEVIAKNVRELGQPALAAAYERRLPRHDVEGEYSRDVLAAAAAGLLRVDAIGRPAARLLPGYRVGIVNRNVAARTDGGPLFGPGPDSRADLSVETQGGASSIDWHVNEADEDVGEGADAYVFDRPGRPVALGCGVDREHPAALARVEIHLPALAGQAGLLADEGRYLLQMERLARIALDAGVQKRAHLRREKALAEGFILERARFVAVACGLDEAVRLFTGWGLANGGPSLDLGKRIVRRLRDVLRADGRAAQLETHLEADVAGGAGMSVAVQMHAGSVIHAGADGGTLFLHLQGEDRRAVLRDAYGRTSIHRLVFCRE